MEVSGQNHALAALALRKNQAPFMYDDLWAPNRTGCPAEDKCLLPMSGFELGIV